jgi:DNA-binding transcriptional regulator YiaG
MNAQEIKALRQSLGLSQYQFAMRLGVTPQTVASWEQGRRKPTGPNRDRLELFVRQNADYQDETTPAAK